MNTIEEKQIDELAAYKGKWRNISFHTSGSYWGKKVWPTEESARKAQQKWHEENTSFDIDNLIIVITPSCIIRGPSKFYLRDYLFGTQIPVKS